jgi:hypothetical protein
MSSGLLQSKCTDRFGAFTGNADRSQGSFLNDSLNPLFKSSGLQQKQ